MSDHTVWAILIVALVARIPTLTSRPLWYDEAFSVLFSATGPRGIAYGTLALDQAVAAEEHPLGYYTLLWIWQEILGAGPLPVRALSVFFGLLTVYLGYRLGRYLFDAHIAALAGLSLALSPFQIHYSQEVRMYALLTTLLLTATLVYRRALDTDSIRYWAAFAVSAAAAQYTHTLAALYLIPLGLTPLWRRKWPELWKTLLAGVFALVLYLPWLVYLPSQLSRVVRAYWIPEPGPAELVRTWLVYVAGLPVPQSVLGVALFGTVLATAFGVWGTIRGWRSRDSTFTHGIWLGYLAIAPAVLMFVLSYWQPVYLERALLTSGAAFLLWISWALSPPRLTGLYSWSGRMALLGTFALGLLGYYTYMGFPYAPYASMNASIASQIGAEEIVLHSNKITALPGRYYDANLAHRYLPDPPESGSDTLAPATQQVLGFTAEADIEAAAKGVAGVWFIIFPREELEYLQAGFADHPSLEWLYSHFEVQSVSRHGELDLYHFVR